MVEFEVELESEVEFEVELESEVGSEVESEVEFEVEFEVVKLVSAARQVVVVVLAIVAQPSSKDSNASWFLLFVASIIIPTTAFRFPSVWTCTIWSSAPKNTPSIVCSELVWMCIWAAA